MINGDENNKARKESRDMSSFTWRRVVFGC